jgi:hypothetical protein
MSLWTGYWPFWLGGAALGVIAVGFYLVARRPLAVSGAYARFVAGPSRDPAIVDGAALEAALLEATRDAFPDAAAAPTGAPAAPLRIAANVTWSAQTIFLVAVFVGAFLAAISSGHFAIRGDLGTDFVRIFGHGWPSFAVLGLGGLLVGFGTRMAGGCTSGHGLSGCARLQSGSLLATATFFGAGVAMSYLLEAVAR